MNPDATPCTYRGVQIAGGRSCLRCSPKFLEISPQKYLESDHFQCSAPSFTEVATCLQYIHWQKLSLSEPFERYEEQLGVSLTYLRFAKNLGMKCKQNLPICTCIHNYLLYVLKIRVARTLSNPISTATSARWKRV